MMATTHGLTGLVLAGLIAGVWPEHAPVALAAGFAGGLAPDLDLYAGHRRTLHFPVYASLGALGALGVAALAPGVATVAAAAFLVGAAAHAASDVLGGGLELRPWESRSERAVFSHYHGRWLAPKRLVPYDGSPHDLLLTVVLAVPAVWATDGALQLLVLGAVAVSTTYVALRKRLAAVAAALASLVPHRYEPYVPQRYR
jgi:hypothetical protein